MKMRRLLKLCSLLAVAAMLAGPLYAQEAAAPAAEPAAMPQEATPPAPGAATPPDTTADVAQQPADDGKPPFNPDEYNSLVFTHWEHVAIQDAAKYRTGTGVTRGVTQQELDFDIKNTDMDEKVKPPPEEREIRLSGIVYRDGKDWTIWLNEKRVTPDAIPEEVLDLKVYKTYIEFKWFDEYTNKIFPIRLRPHQRFNIDTRIFLPG